MGDWEQILRELAETDMRHGGFIKSALDEIEYIRQQLTAALAACEVKDAALELHGKQYPHMVKGYCLDALAIKPDASALKAHDEEKDKIIELLRVDLAANRERADSLQDKLNEIYWRQSQ